jgi:hypothetical protein
MTVAFGTFFQRYEGIYKYSVTGFGIYPLLLGGLEELGV